MKRKAWKLKFALMAQEVDEFKEKYKEYPTKVQNILDDFFDLWPIELPNKLPPMRDIQLNTSLLMTRNYFENY